MDNYTKAMKLSLPLLAAIVLLAAACSHKVSEKDIVGTYVNDPAHKTTNDLEQKMEMTFSADHKFVVVTSTPVNVEGSWSFDESTQKVQVTPVNIDIKNPQTGQETKMTMDQMKQLLQANPNASKETAEFEKISKGSFFEPMEGGKKLYENGQPTLIKKGS